MTGDDLDAHLRRHLADLRGLQVLGMLMMSAEDETRIAALAGSAVGSLVTGFRAHGVALAEPERWVATVPGEDFGGTADLARRLPVGGALSVPGEVWTWAFALGPIARAVGFLVVGGAREPTAQEQLLLQILAHQTGDAVVHARIHSAERAAALDALRASEERFRALAELAPDVIYRLLAHPRRLDYLSPSVTALDGYTPQEHEEDQSRIGHLLDPGTWALLASAARGETPQPVRLAWPHRYGGQVWTEHVVKALYDDDGDLTGLLGVARDVSRQIAMEDQLHARMLQQAVVARFARLALSGVDESALLDRTAEALAETLQVPRTAVVQLDLGTTRPRRRAAHGFERGDAADRPAGDPPGPGRARPVAIVRSLEGSAVGGWDLSPGDRRPGEAGDQRSGACLSVAIEGSDGTWGRLEAYAEGPRAFTPDEIAFAQSLADVVSVALQRRRAEAEIARRALHDPLTGLPNRSLLVDRLTQLLQRASRHTVPVAVLLLDLDHFKVVNDTLGHAAGDALLVAVARRLVDCVRPGDTVARISGDELVVLCSDLDSTAALRVADRVAEALTAPFTVVGRRVHVTASIGVALAREGEAEELLANADAAMYLAKRRGRSRRELFDKSLREELTTRLETEAELRQALARGELRLYFQPIVALTGPTVIGVEALVRWQHPTAGLLPPGRFIPLSEQSNLVVDIGREVLAMAAEHAGRLRAAGIVPASGTVAVNLSARQLERDELPRLVQATSRALEDVGCQLCLEITESAAMSDPEATVAVLHELRAAGATLAIDDFGAGYTSLSYLKRFPVDVLKIDRSFVGGLGEGTDDDAIVTAVIELGHGLDLAVLAEGVEHVEQRDRLARLGCDLAQGYLWARPAPLEDVERRLREIPLTVAVPPLSGGAP